MFSTVVSEKEPSLLSLLRAWSSFSNGWSSLKSRFPEAQTAPHCGAVLELQTEEKHAPQYMLIQIPPTYFELREKS